jgi:hypothetical protein
MAMPGRKWYAIALLILVGGGAASATVIFVGLSGLTRELPQVLVPGDATLTVNRPGTYTIFFERETVMDGQYYSTKGDISGLRVRLISSNGAPISLSEPAAGTSYSIGGRSGVAVLACNLSQPGTYALEADYADGRREPQGVLAIGLGVGARIATTILAALALGGGAALAALIVAAVTFKRRRRAAHSNLA